MEGKRFVPALYSDPTRRCLSSDHSSDLRWGKLGSVEGGRGEAALLLFVGRFCGSLGPGRVGSRRRRMARAAPGVRWRRLQQILEVGVIFAALGTIPLTIAQQRGDTSLPVLAGDWAVWSVFFIEYVVGVRLAENRWAYTRRNWLSVAVILVSFPLLPALFALTRLARLLRLFRLVRLGAVGARGVRALRQALGRKGLVYIGAVVVFLVLIGGGLLSILEPENVKGGFWSGIWWAVVTVTTVGYGDIAPTTPEGRVIAAFLMVAGIGLVATLAASVAAYFVGQTENSELKEILTRLERIEGILGGSREDSA
jgi:voltage-gated potassium channel